MRTNFIAHKLVFPYLLGTSCLSLWVDCLFLGGDFFRSTRSHDPSPLAGSKTPDSASKVSSQSALFADDMPYLVSFSSLMLVCFQFAVDCFDVYLASSLLLDYFLSSFLLRKCFKPMVETALSSFR